jgi:hypothetical protein
LVGEKKLLGNLLVVEGCRARRIMYDNVGRLLGVTEGRIMYPQHRQPPGRERQSLPPPAREEGGGGGSRIEADPHAIFSTRRRFRAFIMEEVFPMHFLAGFMALLVALTTLFKAETNVDRAPGVIMIVLWTCALSLASWCPELYKRHFELIANVVKLIRFASRHLAGGCTAVESSCDPWLESAWLVTPTLEPVT